ncbi:UNVERIFIED_CONTAM: hypothetical protein GTU68_066962 [Idotea baltica]|nr:hypothetical protein [Idotea baltica]
MKIVSQVKPHQCTLVPDAPDALTSDNGWDTIGRQAELKDIVARLQDQGVRVSLFLNPQIDLVYAAKETGADRIEFYTGPYAHDYTADRIKAVADYKIASLKAAEIGLAINAGHDLNLDNLTYFKSEVANLQEVSIGHALVVDALYYGLSSTMQMYLQRLKD